MNFLFGRPVSRLFRQPRAWNPKSQTRFESSQTSTTSRLERLNNQLPPSLRKLTTPLLNAPVSHVTAFLVLHELTAIVPLVGLAATFHYANWVPDDWAKSEWVDQGVTKWGRYLRKKGWISQDEEQAAEEAVGDNDANVSEKGVKLVLEVATAWALVKMAIPLRIVASVGLTPWFARTVIVPIGRVFRR